MPWYRVALSLIAPPLAVVDKGIKALALTSVLTFLGWVPGVICAFVYSSQPTKTTPF